MLKMLPHLDGENYPTLLWKDSVIAYLWEWVGICWWSRYHVVLVAFSYAQLNDAREPWRATTDVINDVTSSVAPPSNAQSRDRDTHSFT